MEYEKNNLCFIKCSKCKKVYRNKIYYKYHIHNMSSVNGNYKCNKCNKQYKTLSGFTYHMINKHC